MTDVADTQQLLRLIQSVPSPNVTWLWFVVEIFDHKICKDKTITSLTKSLY
jgi:hypothetical protein